MGRSGMESQGEMSTSGSPTSGGLMAGLMAGGLGGGMDGSSMEGQREVQGGMGVDSAVSAMQSMMQSAMANSPPSNPSSIQTTQSSTPPQHQPISISPTLSINQLNQQIWAMDTSAAPEKAQAGATLVFYHACIFCICK